MSSNRAFGRAQANVHTTNRDAVGGFIDDTVHGPVGVNATLNSVPRALSPMRLKNEPLKVKPHMVGDFFRRAHALHSKLYQELREQAMFYSPQLHATLGKLWMSNDRVIKDMAAQLDSHALHIKALQLIHDTGTKDANIKKTNNDKIIRRLHSELRQAHQEIHSLKARLKVAEHEGRLREREKDKLEEMLFTYAYGADAIGGKPDWEKDFTVLEEMEETLVELSEEIVWAKGIHGEMDSLVSRVGVANSAALEEAAKREEERLQKQMEQLEAQAQRNAQKKRRKAKGTSNVFANAKKFLMSTQKKSLGALTRNASVQAGTSRLRLAHRYYNNVDIIVTSRDKVIVASSKHDQQQANNFENTEQSLVRATIVKPPESTMFTLHIYPHLHQNMSRRNTILFHDLDDNDATKSGVEEKTKPELQGLPRNTHDIYLSYNKDGTSKKDKVPKKVGKTSTQMGYSTKDKKSRSPKANHKNVQYVIKPEFLSPSVASVLDMSHLRARKWHVYDIEFICHNIMSIYVKRIKSVTKDKVVENLSPNKHTRMRERRDGEISPFIATLETKTNFMKFIASYFEHQMNVKTLGDWYAAQLMLNVTRHHDEAIIGPAAHNLRWFDYRIILFGKLTGAFTSFVGESRTYKNVQCVNIVLKTVQMICRMSAPTISYDSLANDATNQNLLLSYDRICEPIILNLFAKIFSVGKEHLHECLTKLVQHANAVAEKKRKERQALLEDGPEDARKKRQRRKSTSVLQQRPQSPTMPVSAQTLHHTKADQVELDFFIFTVVESYLHFRRIQKVALIQIFEEQRMQLAKVAKEQILTKRKKEGINPTASSNDIAHKSEEKDKEGNENTQSKKSEIPGLRIDVTLDFDSARRELQLREDTIDAIELGLLPWSDCLNVIQIVKARTEKSNENSKVDDNSPDSRVAKVVSELNLLANNETFWKSLVNNGVCVEAKKRALEKEIRDYRSSPKSTKKKLSIPSRNEPKWKNFTEDDIETLLLTRTLSPGIDSQTFVEILMRYNIGLTMNS